MNIYICNIQGVAKQLQQTSQGHGRAENNWGCTSKKKFYFSFATELWAFEIEKLKHIFINISKTTDQNLTKFCTLTFPATLFPMMTPFFSIMIRLVKTTICTQIMPKK